MPLSIKLTLCSQRCRMANPLLISTWMRRLLLRESLSLFAFELYGTLIAAFQVYRRFQITFTTAASAAQFIDAVRPVCPCRLNPQPQPLVTRIPPVATTGLIDDIPRQGTIRTAVSQARPSMSGAPFRLAPTTLLSGNPSSESSLPVFALSTPVDFTPVALSSSSMKTTSVTTPSHDGTFVIPTETPRIILPKSTQCQALSGSIYSTKGSLLDSSQPSSSTLSSPNMMPPPPLPSSVT
ncbi:uncharacterized protein F5147DRAFT_429016 [Suillus discolor]|uniref:Uncharacterized protein n=1 Tax=Suillus discolor TaxID=1912936 RepID=A0A9P7FD42_9AGAM|nr:uncharacterized protein F5147DRAFT_429016 [Suillus discolor]KAG2114607.1 hypothetical protein F5147DRAFT_429016 [Suillus discolor]